MCQEYILKHYSCYLIGELWDVFKKVRICSTIGFQRLVFNLYYEDIGSLTFDLEQWRWNGKKWMVSYNVKLGRKLIRAKIVFKCNVF
jgi:hypothetical protein